MWDKLKRLISLALMAVMLLGMMPMDALAESYQADYQLKTSVYANESATTTESAQVYYLKTPTSNPRSNNTDQWGKQFGTVTINTTDIKWESDNRNSYDDVAGRVTSWTSGSYTLSKSGSEYEHWKAIYDAFKSTVSGIHSENDVEAIILHPYKISRNNGTTPDKHVDCTVEIRAKNVYTATYWLWDANGTGYEWIAAENLHEGDKTNPNQYNATKDLPAVKTDSESGIKYVFDGWYTNSARTGDPVVFDYTIGTGNVNFYAKYVPVYDITYRYENAPDLVTPPAAEYDVKSGSSKDVPAEPAAVDGYRFLGWASQNVSNDEIKEGKYVMPESDVEWVGTWLRKTSASLTLGGTKSYNGPTAKAFTIELYEVNDDGIQAQPPKDSVTVTVPAAAEGENQYTARSNGYSFTGITYNQIGTYTYSVRESIPSETKGVTYDTAVYTIIVEVRDDGTDTLETEVTSVWKNGLTQATATTLNFDNTYSATGTWAPGGLEKKYHRPDPENPEDTSWPSFGFTINENGIRVGHGYNAYDGSLVFDEPVQLDLTSLGMHTYTISEDPDTLYYPTGDNKNYTVNVTDDGEGNLVGTVQTAPADKEYHNYALMDVTIRKEVDWGAITQRHDDTFIINYAVKKNTGDNEAHARGSITVGYNATTNRYTYNGTASDGATIQVPYGYYLTVTEASDTAWVASGEKTNEQITANQTVTIKNMPGTGALTVTKNVSGLTNGLADLGSDFEITVTGPNNYSAAIGRQQLISGNGSVTLTGLTSGAYTVSESNHYVNGYHVTESYADSDTATGDSANAGAATVAPSTDDGVVTVNPGATSTMTITNSYATQGNGSLTIEKTRAGDNQRLANVQFTLANESGSYNVKVTTDRDGIASFTNIPVGTYTLTEVEAPTGYVKMADKTVVVSYNADNTQNATVTVDDDVYTDNTIPVVNELSANLSFTLTKSVSDTAFTDLEPTDKFGFTVTLTHPSIESYTVTAGTTEYPSDANGKVEFTGSSAIELANGESMTITGMPVGTVITVTENLTPAQQANTWSTVYKAGETQTNTVTIDSAAKEMIVTNTRMTKPSVTFNKQWIENGKTALRPSTAVFKGMLTLKATADGSTEDTEQTPDIAVNAQDGSIWTITYSNLPTADKAGNAYSYTLEETLTGAANDWYTGNPLSVAENGTLVNTRKDTAGISISKTVTGIDDAHQRDDAFSFTVTLPAADYSGAKIYAQNGVNAKVPLSVNTATGGTTRTVTVTGVRSGDTVTLSGDLPYGTYTVTEVIPNDAKYAYTTTEESSSYTFAFTNTVVNADAQTVTKVWKDNSNAYGTRPGSVTLKVIGEAEGTTVYTRDVTLTAQTGDTWTTQLNDLPATYEGKTISYRVVEPNAPDVMSDAEKAAGASYVKEENGLTVTNTLAGTMSSPLVFTKEWEEYGFTGYRPTADAFKGMLSLTSKAGSITGKNAAGATVTYDQSNQMTVTDGTGADQMTITITGLPLYNAEGVKHAYTLAENLRGTAAAVYEAAVSSTDNTGTPLKNTLKTTTISGTKTWENVIGDEQPSAITVTVAQNGNPYGMATVELVNHAFEVSEVEAGSATKRLPAFDTAGNAYTYTIDEYASDANGNAIAGYYKKSMEEKEGTYAITNDVQTGSLTITKTGEGNGVLAGVKFTLTSKNASAPWSRTVQTGTDGKAVFTGIPEGTYTLTEVEAPEGYVKMADKTVVVSYNTENEPAATVEVFDEETQKDRKTNEIQVTNLLDDEGTSFTLMKSVVDTTGYDNLANSARFRFTVTLTHPNIKSYRVKVGTTEYQSDANGKVEFAGSSAIELANGESKTITGMPVGTVITAEENLTDAQKTNTWTVGYAGTTAVTENGATKQQVTIEATGKVKAVTVTNTRKLVGPDPVDPDQPDQDYGKIIVTKAWKPADFAAIPNRITVDLYRKGADERIEKIDSKTLEKTSGWTKPFTNLPCAGGDGRPYVYFVREANELVDGQGNRSVTHGGFTYSVTAEDLISTKNRYKLTNTLKDDEPGKPTKEADKQSAEIGDAVMYTIAFTNNLAESAKVTIKDALPAGLEFVSTNSTKVTDAAGTTTDASAGFDQQGQKLTWVFAGVPPKATVQVVFTAKLTAEAVKKDEITNTASAEVNDNPAGQSEGNTVKVKAPRLSITKTATLPDPSRNYVTPGERIQYTIVLTNSGEGKATDVVVTDTLPDGVTLVDEEALDQRDDVVVNGHTITWTIAEIAGGDSEPLTFSVEVHEAAEKITNTATITEQPVKPEGDPEGKVETLVGMVDVEKTATVYDALSGKEKNGEAGLNDTIRYTVTVTNTGEAELKNLRVYDAMLSKAVAGSVKLGGEEAIVNGTADPYVVIATLAVGDEIELIYDYVVTEEDVFADFVVNTATVKQDTSDEEPADLGGNNEDSEEVPTVDPRAILETGKEILNRQETYGIGDVIQYQVTATNTGNVTAHKVIITDALVSSANPNGLVMTREVGDLAPGASYVWTYTYMVQEADVLPIADANGNQIVHTISNEAVASGMDGKENPTESIPDKETVIAEQVVMIRFVDSMDGAILKEVCVPYGGSTSTPREPYHGGYVFTGWVGGIWQNVTSDQIIFSRYDRTPCNRNTTILDAEIPLAGGYISNVGDCFD